MKTRHQRIVFIVGSVALLGVIIALVLNALNSNISLYVSPSDVFAGKAPQGKSFRLGGVVAEGSLKREPDGVTMRFLVTDTNKSIRVRYTGILPDLFREGRGVVAGGTIDQNGDFVASEVLAKHDENYMPPEAAQALKDAEKSRLESSAGEAQQSY